MPDELAPPLGPFRSPWRVADAWVPTFVSESAAAATAAAVVYSTVRTRRHGACSPLRGVAWIFQTRRSCKGQNRWGSVCVAILWWPAVNCRTWATERRNRARTIAASVVVIWQTDSSVWFMVIGFGLPYMLHVVLPAPTRRCRCPPPPQSAKHRWQSNLQSFRGRGKFEVHFFSLKRSINCRRKWTMDGLMVSRDKIDFDDKNARFTLLDYSHVYQ